MLTPLVFHYEFRTPPAIQSETDEAGQAVISMADYSGRIVFDAEATAWSARFELNKQLVLKGATLEQRCNGRTIQLRIEPIKKGANPAHALDGGSPFHSRIAAHWPAASDVHRSATQSLSGVNQGEHVCESHL